MSDDLVKRLRSIDQGSLEDCFCQSFYFVKAADRIEELEAKLQKWVGVIEQLDDNTLTRVDWVAGGGNPDGEFCRLGLVRTLPDGTELLRTYVAIDEWTPRKRLGLGVDGGDI
jgi:hypothetical protein